MGNFGLWALAALGRGGKALFLGQLRPQEVELLSDNLKPTIMSLLFFLTIFRTQFNATFFAAIACLLFVKAAHWVTEARVNFMEQSPADSRVVYYRLGALIWLLASVDFWCARGLRLRLCADTLRRVARWAMMQTLTYGPSLALLFGFEFIVLYVRAMSIFAHFVLNLISISRDQVWHAKGTYVLYLEFVVATLQSVAYVGFFLTVFRYYGLPLHILRSMYLTFVSFQRALEKARPPPPPPSPLAHSHCGAAVDVSEGRLRDGPTLPRRHTRGAGKRRLHLHCVPR